MRTRAFRYGAAALLIAVLSVAGAYAQHTTTFEQVTVANTAIGVTATVSAGMAGCGFRLETAQVRWRIDAAPTASVGTLLEVGDVLTVTRIEDARRITFIRTGATSALLNVFCWSAS